MSKEGIPGNNSPENGPANTPEPEVVLQEIADQLKAGTLTAQEAQQHLTALKKTMVWKRLLLNPTSTRANNFRQQLQSLEAAIADRGRQAQQSSFGAQLTWEPLVLPGVQASESNVTSETTKVPLREAANEYVRLVRADGAAVADAYLRSIDLQRTEYPEFRKLVRKVEQTLPPEFVVSTADTDAVVPQKLGTQENPKNIEAALQMIEKDIQRAREALATNDTDSLFDHPISSQFSVFGKLYGYVRNILPLLTPVSERIGFTVQHNFELSVDDLDENVREIVKLLKEILRVRENTIQKSANNLLLADVLADSQAGIEFSNDTELDQVTTTRIGAAAAFSTSSDEAIKGGKFGQDAAGIQVFFNDRGEPVYKLVTADGVGQSALGEISAREMVRLTLEIEAILQQNGTADATRPSKRNTALGHISEQDIFIVSLLKKIDVHAAIDAENLLDMVREALKDLVVNFRGSHTMFHTVTINAENGLVEGTFMGDGGISILRATGVVEHFSTGSHRTRLTTGAGIENPEGIRVIQDLVPGLVLEPGDSLLLYTDGILYSGATHVRDQLAQLVQQYQWGEITSEACDAGVQKLLADTSYYTGGNDDRTVAVYTHPHTMTVTAQKAPQPIQAPVR